MGWSWLGMGRHNPSTRSGLWLPLSSLCDKWVGNDVSNLNNDSSFRMRNSVHDLTRGASCRTLNHYSRNTSDSMTLCPSEVSMDLLRWWRALTSLSPNEWLFLRADSRSGQSRQNLWVYDARKQTPRKAVRNDRKTAISRERDRSPSLIQWSPGHSVGSLLGAFSESPIMTGVSFSVRNCLTKVFDISSLFLRLPIGDRQGPFPHHFPLCLGRETHRSQVKWV
jgi:hypothetical protein